MIDDRDMPPDPWAEQGVDPWEIEQAEQLAHDGAAPDDPRWDHLDGPTTDEFYDAERELRTARAEEFTEIGPLAWRAIIASVAVVVAIALLVLVLR